MTTGYQSVLVTARMGTLLCLFCLLPAFAFSQSNNWNWPEDKKTAQEKKVLYTDSMEHGDYLGAVASLEWLIARVPDLNPALYIHGATIYQKLAETTTETEQRNAYKERMLAMFDLRMQHFNDEKNVLNRKALVAYQLYKKEPEHYPMLLTLFREALALNGPDITPFNLLAYMDVLQREKKQTRSVSEETIIAAYMQVKDILLMQKERGDSERLKKIADGVDKIFVGSVKVDCHFVHKEWAPQLGSSGTHAAKYVVNFLLIAGCNTPKDHALFLRAGRTLYAAEPTLAMAKALAKRSMLTKDYPAAVSYYQKALGHLPADDKTARADIHMGLAKAHVGAWQKAKARQYALQAAQNPKHAKDAYNLVGNLYLSSYADCKKGVSRVEDKAIYLAAYDMFKMADNVKMMEGCERQFPTIGDMFELGKSEGESIKISCWFSEEVILRRSPSK